ncbi:telomeric repeat-binding factor 1 [Micropterus dolomieu]|uniref:telomeric repeat-binding factor 1 n=1 Tax=Micropterus dolomieu TaxID=147949 RepID=UPI001E8DF5BA|nr:telomeric repeat-binding factor 1 [Micropterus dolomieu]
MDSESNNKSVTDASSTDESVSFSHVTAVATGWMLDFMFVSLCRHFQEGKHDEFNETLSTLEGISQSSSLKGDLHDEKMMICAFLARVMHGKQLDVQFEEDDRVMPLMSAANIWSKLEKTVADEGVFRNVTILLLVQSVSVCLEKGQKSSAVSALKWFEKNRELPQNFGTKLSTIVTQGETYHPFFTSFSFSRLLEATQSFLDAYLEKNPSDYILKAATEMVKSSHNFEGLEDVVTQDSPLSKPDDTSDEESSEDRKKKENTVHLRTKRKLLSTKMTDVWKPDICTTPFVSLRRISQNELSQMISEKSMNASPIKKTRKPPQKWTAQLDKYLKNGVKRHGQGKWSRILMDYDFEGRTGTMLKDRWRVLMRTHEVG